MSSLFQDLVGEPDVLFGFVGLCIILALMIYYSKAIYSLYSLEELRRLKVTILVLMLLTIDLAAAFATLKPSPLFLAISIVTLILGLSYLFKIYKLYRAIFCISCGETKEKSLKKEEK